ncbi:hypothetical protein [Luteolibacter soli]|uniref:MAPEG family protein n=1 Tax=Luteolibacter soli TaxID=3135280 RepID=A0ABU9B1S6_9BACT
MTTETLVIALRIAGLMMAGIVMANFVAARRLRYRESLARCEVMVRQIFHVHCAYIIAIVGGLGVLCLGWPQLLLADSMGRVLSGFFGLFWTSRVIVQLTYYDKETRRNERGWDLFFLGVFLTLGIIFTLAAIYG